MRKIVAKQLPIVASFNEHEHARKFRPTLTVAGHRYPKTVIKSAR